jgi:HEAT repeat protein
MKAERDVPGLIEALRSQESSAGQAAAKALGEIGDSKALLPLISALRDHNQDTRSAAAIALGQLGDPRSVPPLITALIDDNKGRMRGAVVEALGKLGDKRAVPHLIAALDDEQVRQSAVEALDTLGYQPDKSANAAAYWMVKGQWDRCVEIGADAIEPLIMGLQDGWGVVRKTAAEALERLNWEPDSTYSIVYWMAKGFWDRCIEMGQPAIAPLAKALSNPDLNVRRCAAGALGQIGARLGNPQYFDTALAPLVDRLRDEWPDVRQAATWALGQIGDVTAIDALIQFAIADESEKVRRDAQVALVRMGIPVIQPLLAVVNKPTLHKPVIEVLRQMGTPVVEWLIATALDESKGDLRHIATQTLGELGDSHAVEPLILIVMLEDSWEVRRAAAYALGKLGDSSAIEPLNTALKDSNEKVRIAAASALAQLGDSRGIDFLIPVIEYNESMRSSAIEVLVKDGKRSVSPLLDILKYTTWPARQAVAQALVTLYRSGSLADKDKNVILSLRDRIIMPHHDFNEHDDNKDSLPYRKGCTPHEDYISHADEGVGVGFPL